MSEATYYPPTKHYAMIERVAKYAAKVFAENGWMWSNLSSVDGTRDPSRRVPTADDIELTLYGLVREVYFGKYCYRKESTFCSTGGLCVSRDGNEIAITFKHREV